MSYFDTPETNTVGDNFSAKENVGKLLLFIPKSYEAAVPTINGEKDAVKTDVIVFDGKDVTEFPDTLIFQGFLISALKSKAKAGTGRVLARLGQGEAKKGWNAPYILTEPSAEDKAVAVAWIEKNADPFSV